MEREPSLLDPLQSIGIICDWLECLTLELKVTNLLFADFLVWTKASGKDPKHLVDETRIKIELDETD